jgi:hypothetical protein
MFLHRRSLAIRVVTIELRPRAQRNKKKGGGHVLFYSLIHSTAHTYCKCGVQTSCHRAVGSAEVNWLLFDLSLLLSCSINCCHTATAPSLLYEKEGIVPPEARQAALRGIIKAADPRDHPYRRNYPQSVQNRP